ncbi:PLP-dependent aminotransferase family protein [Clostridium oceanicum]|uniref:PLP-dependent aminotransferase family protein n=1 Tax=Clostridium oceanicum TaxID=1543 RepID=A0ABN1JLC5_9CLOT
MKLYVDKKSKTSLTRQLYDELQNRIDSGILKPNEKLPSVRKLSLQLSISKMTVVKAYELLEKNGFIYKEHGKGTYVKSKNIDFNHNIEVEEIDKNNWKNNIEDYIVRKGYRQRNYFNLKELGCNLAIAGLNERFLPTKTIIDTFIDNYNEKELGKHSPVEGEKSLIDKVCGYLVDKGVEASNQEVLITSGSQLAINVIAQTFIGHGDVVVVGAPTFSGAIDVFKSRGANVIEVPMTPEGLDVNSLLIQCEKYPVKALYTMPTFQNPTGISASLEVRQEILSLADEHNFIIIEDDCWSDLYYEEFKKPLKSLDKNNRVIYIAGFSKTLGPSYKLSAVVADEIFLRKLAIVKSTLDTGAPLINQVMVASYIGSIEHKKHLIWVRDELKQLLMRIKKYLEKISPSYVKVTIPKGGLILWLTLPDTFDCKILYYKAIFEENILFILGENYYSSGKGGNQLRICFTYDEEEKVLQGLGKIIDMIKELHQMIGNGTQIPMT